MRLSIIVPAYKVEPYIEKCILSLEAQDITQTDFEIIVTNDGSPDKSAQIVENLQKEFPNIKLINQQNQGVSMARNNAIAVAKGQYILPIDPDDYVVENTLGKILNKAESEKLDIFYPGYEIFDANGNSSWQADYSKIDDKIHDGVSGYFAPRGNDVRDPDHSAGVLFKREMLVKYELKYPEGVPFLEDGLFLVKAFSVANRVGFDSTKFYQRTTSVGSATVSGVYYSDKAIDGFLKAAADLRTFAKKFEFTQSQRGLLNHGIANFVLLAIFPLVSLKFGRLAATIQKIKELGFSRLETSGVVWPYDKYTRRFNISPYFFALMFAGELAVKKLFP
jgi:glycosyltransferase involved in cell wall biosynthesis